MVTCMQQSDRAQSGFALLECLIAMLVLTVLAVSLLAGERSGNLVARHTLEEGVAMQTLESRLDQLRAAPTSPELGERVFSPEPHDLELRDQRAIERVAELEPGLFEVEVAVAWKPFAATATVSRSLVTRIARQVKR